MWCIVFWTSPHPSSGAYDCARSLWFYLWREVAGALLAVVCQTTEWDVFVCIPSYMCLIAVVCCLLLEHLLSLVLEGLLLCLQEPTIGHLLGPYDWLITLGFGASQSTAIWLIDYTWVWGLTIHGHKIDWLHLGMGPHSPRPYDWLITLGYGASQSTAIWLITLGYGASQSTAIWLIDYTWVWGLTVHGHMIDWLHLGLGPHSPWPYDWLITLGYGASQSTAIWLIDYTWVWDLTVNGRISKVLTEDPIV